MSEPSQEPYDIYQDPSPYGNAPLLVKLVGIFTIVVAGLDIIYGVVMLMSGIFIGTGAMPIPAFEVNPAGGAGAPAVPPPPLAFFVWLLVFITLIAVCAGIVKLIAGIKILRRRRSAWGWGLAVGIVGCLQLWCVYFCVVPLGVGIFTIVVMSLEGVRRYLRDSAAGTLVQ